MTTKEASIQELKKLKGKPLKEKLEHIITYYWIPLLLIVLLVSILASQIFHFVTAKDSALSVVLINSIAESKTSQAYMSRYASQAEIDLDKNDIFASTSILISNDDPLSSYQGMQTLGAHIAAESVDVLVADKDTMMRCFYQDIFWDLSQVLPEEQQLAYEEYYLYLDKAILDTTWKTRESIPEYPDPTKPEDMKQPIPVALALPGNLPFVNLFYPYINDQVAVGLIINSQNIPNGLMFLDYIYNEE